jgi:hypothetical protein
MTKRGFAVYETKEDVDGECGQHLFDELNSTGAWWSLMPHWDSETTKLTGFIITVKVGHQSARYQSMTVAGCIQKAMQWITKKEKTEGIQIHVDN